MKKHIVQVTLLVAFTGCMLSETTLSFPSGSEDLIATKSSSKTPITARFSSNTFSFKRLASLVLFIVPGLTPENNGQRPSDVLYGEVFPSRISKNNSLYLTSPKCLTTQ